MSEKLGMIDLWTSSYLCLLIILEFIVYTNLRVGNNVAEDSHGFFLPKSYLILTFHPPPYQSHKNIWECLSLWPSGTEQVVSSIPGSVGYISHVHWAYDYSGPFGVYWVHMAWHTNCVYLRVFHNTFSAVYFQWEILAHTRGIRPLPRYWQAPFYPITFIFFHFEPIMLHFQKSSSSHTTTSQHKFKMPGIQHSSDVYRIYKI